MSNVDVVEEIKSYFVHGGKDHSFKISGLLTGYEAYVTKTSGMTGVFIPCIYNEKLHEKFAKVELQYLPKIILNGQETSGFYLYMNDKEATARILREFATICSNFVDPGEKGLNRKNIVENPLEWWKAWKLIIGNANREKMVYALIGEMMVYHYLLQQGSGYTWTGADKKRIDFVNGIEDVEVKSTTKRNGEEITVHGVFQMSLCDNAKLSVLFCRLEENPKGKSINNMIDILVADGCDRNYLEQVVADCGFMDGASDRNIPYLLLEARKYPVNDAFPKITPAAFAGGAIPSGISNLQYTVDLANLQYDKVNLF